MPCIFSSFIIYINASMDVFTGGSGVSTNPPMVKEKDSTVFFFFLFLIKNNNILGDKDV